LEAEIRQAGYSDIKVVGVEGPAWSAGRFNQAWDNEVQRKSLMEFLAVIEREPSILGASAHLVAVAQRPKKTQGNKQR